MLPTTLLERLKQSELLPDDQLTQIFEKVCADFQKIKQDRFSSAGSAEIASNDAAALSFNSTEFDLNLPGETAAKASPRLDYFENFFLAELERQGAINAWQAEQLRHGRVRFYLGRYRVVDLLGRGGYGNVFLGRLRVHSSNRDRDAARFHNDVALKVLPLNASELAQRQFLHEIEISKLLRHPNLVRFIEASKDASVHYAVYEYVDGGDARALLERFERLPFRVAAYIASETAKALAHLHSLGVVHRDVKPGNILLMRNGEVKLADFGFISPIVPFSSTARLSPIGAVIESWETENADLLATENDASSGEKTAKRKIKGTPDYLAPDQITHPNFPSPLWDVYSLGSALYFMLTGVVPFPANDSREKLQAHLRSTLPPEPVSFSPNIPLELSQLTMRMIERDPARRVSSAGEIVEALHRWAEPYDQSAQNALSTFRNRDADADFWTNENLRSVYSSLVSPLGAEAAAPPPSTNPLKSFFTRWSNQPKSEPAQSAQSPSPQPEEPSDEELEKPKKRLFVPDPDFGEKTRADANFEAAFGFVEEAFESAQNPASPAPTPTPPQQPKSSETDDLQSTRQPVEPTPRQPARQSTETVVPRSSSPAAAPTASSGASPTASPSESPKSLDAAPSAPSAPQSVAASSFPTPAEVAPVVDLNAAEDVALERLEAQTQRLEQLNAKLLRRALVPLLVATAAALVAALVKTFV